MESLHTKKLTVIKEDEVMTYDVPSESSISGRMCAILERNTRTSSLEDRKKKSKEKLKTVSRSLKLQTARLSATYKVKRDSRFFVYFIRKLIFLLLLNCATHFRRRS